MTGLHLRGVVLPDGHETDLWVVNGRIRTERVFGATTVVDRGYFVPGLVDAHCHVGLGAEGAVPLPEAVEQARIDRDTGTLLIRDCGSPLDTRPLQERLDLPRIVRAGRHIARPKRYLRYLGVEVERESDLPTAVAEQIQYGDGWIKLVGDWIDRTTGDLEPLWSDDVLRDAIKVAHDAGARVTAHVFGEAALPGLLAAGIDCVEHGTGLTDDTIDLMASAGTALVPTLINIENFPGIASDAGKYPAYQQHMRDLYSRSKRTIGAAIEAGVPVYAGTDAGGGIAHGRIVDEIEALHGVGMTGHQALAAASWAARAWLGHPGLVEGAAADIVVYDDDPRTALTTLRHPRLVMLRGRIH
ncbi:amidohydrolase family protein [Saccharothrix violaceirubra]|uniref:Imidazolonepropionase-like amidohydrolase n=1 Tax=Saccharothrix violaceirubra TaxID=413306 RepID=A0A7W7WU57_9PSEU|nr:amidohydrolase family protein [Saccharothrix violaceirubra]MBB4963935.1 imidazolonepropionase-like amidohydrolase [Saccharothrix violaceirubra]